MPAVHGEHMPYIESTMKYVPAAQVPREEGVLLGGAPLDWLAVGVRVPVGELERELVNVPVEVGTAQATEPLAEVVPTGQAWHAAALGAPVDGLKVLGGHCVERATPPKQKEPAGHTSQEPPVEPER